MRLLAPALAFLLLAPPARAVPRALQPAAPEFPATDLWANAKGLTMKRLRGRRVVLVAFVNTANINSLRALSILKSWDARYGLEGLSIVAVHTPLYGFQRDPDVVGVSLKRLGVTFPVIFDDDRALWKAYANEGWPALYLVDYRGKIIYDTLGEGGYEEFEEEIRDALGEAGYRPERNKPLAANPPSQYCGATTPELSFSMKAAKPVKVFDLDTQEQAAQVPAGELIISARDGEIGQRGAWRREPEAMRLTASNADHSSFLRVICRGVQVFGLFSGLGRGKRAKFFIRQDGLWLHSGNAGGDIKFDDDGRSYVEADEPKLYWIVKNTDDSEHAVAVMPLERNAAVHSFQFADRCLPYKP
jgi:hypothetical protein